MAEIRYRIVEHDGGWAYTVDNVYSETFRTHDQAADAARAVAAEQAISGSTTAIEYQDAEGQWKTEIARGDDRPHAEVED